MLEAIRLATMNEKELLVTLAEEDLEVDILLAAMRKPSKGNFRFKKGNLKRLIKKDLDFNFINDIFFVWEKKGFPDRYANCELPILLKRLNADNLSKMLQYLTIKYFYSDFIDEKFDVIVDNTIEGRDPFDGLHGFDNDRDLEVFYQNNFTDFQEMQDLIELDQIVKWFEEVIIPLEGYKKRLTSIDLPEFDRLISARTRGDEWLISPSFLKKEDRLHYKNPNVTEELIQHITKSLDGEGVKVALYLAYLEVGLYSEHIKSTLLDAMQRSYLTFRMQLMGSIKHIDEALMVAQYNSLVKEHDELSGKVQKIESEHQLAIEKVSKRLEASRKEKEQIEKNAKEITDSYLELKNQVEEGETLASGYKQMLSDDFTNLKTMVIHHSQLLYAPFLYPDIKFIAFDEVVENSFYDSSLVLIQRLGNSSKQAYQLEMEAKVAGCDVLFLQCEDERQLIMELVRVIDERRLS